MIQDMHKEYPDMSEDAREFARRLLFIELIENIHTNRSSLQGPKTIKQLMHNDVEEFLNHQNFEAAWIYRDVRDQFKADIEEFDSGY